MPAIAEFWRDCRSADPRLPRAEPNAWSFGATPTQADELLALVLDGTKTATSSPLWDYQHGGEPLPQAGQFDIVLDGNGTPRALIETLSVEIVPFSRVSAAHACAEGEGDRSLRYWRDEHERFWRAHSEHPRGFDPQMPVVCETFCVRYSA